MRLNSDQSLKHAIAMRRTYGSWKAVREAARRERTGDSHAPDVEIERNTATIENRAP